MLHPLGVVERLALRDGHQDLVGLGVLAPRVVAVGGGDQRDAQVARELADAVVDRQLLLERVRLHLEIEPVAEDRVQLLGLAAGLVHVAAADRLGHRAGHAGGERDDPLVVRAEQLLVHPRVVVEPLGERLGRQVAQVPVAEVVHRQQHEVVTDSLRLVGPALLARDVGLEADDRLDAVLLRLFVEVDDAEHVAVVGDGHRLHAGVGAGLHEIRQADRAVEEAVERVQVEMGEVGGHGDGSSGAAGAGSQACRSS